jgi:hypothetical protein
MPSSGSRAYYASSVSSFIETDAESILGRLATRVSSEHRGNEIEQIDSWRRQLTLLRSAVGSLGETVSAWGLLLELPLLRLGRRIDAVILVRDVVVVIEFKIGASAYAASDREQVEDYALCLRDFHAGSAGKLIVPVLCADHAPKTLVPNSLQGVVDGVAETVLANAESLSDVLRSVANACSEAVPQLEWREFDQAGYNPTPTIIEAARAVYSGHKVQDIGRADATGESLARAAERLDQIVQTARRAGDRRICFVTGTPGSGKTLLGLDLVFSGEAGRVAGEPAAMLSGNPPLVHVLREALAEDAAQRQGTKKEARRRAQAALQTLLGYLKEHAAGQKPPPENVIVYDEAQRAWDEETGKKLLGRPRSEPALFLEIMSRHQWSCLVCLVGAGQEINRGEGGLSLWGQALSESARNGIRWRVHAAPEALAGPSATFDDRLLGGGSVEGLEVIEEPALHLSVGVRAYRNSYHDRWVSAVLSGDLTLARSLTSNMSDPPAYLTRDLASLRLWLKDRERGGRRAGLLVSSGAIRLIAEGLPPSPRSNELDSVAHWFLRSRPDFRSSNALETPLSEFVCQGLEVDCVGLCWGGDLIWKETEWVARTMRAPKWQIVRNDSAIRYRLNAYRVLMTRARTGLTIFVPRGDQNDPTRDPLDFNRTAEALQSAGCAALDECTTSTRNRAFRGAASSPDTK